jgi:hypothetical protein
MRSIIMRKGQHRSSSPQPPKEKGPRGRGPFQSRGEEGQSLLEMAAGLVFLLGIVLILFESGMLFYTYISLLNATREGAAYAAKHPELAGGLPSNDPVWVEYLSRTTEEVNAAGLETGNGELIQSAPVVGPCGTDRLCPITVTLHYSLTNPTQGLILPMVGRMGLFRNVWISARTDMPIR